ncbi:MAG: GNAT family N-acetyltransferase, partial [Solimonas sp.]
RLAAELEDHAFAVVDLSAGYERYWATRSGNTRRKVNQKSRRIEDMGATVDGVLPADTGDVESRIGRLIAVTEASYKLQGQRLADRHRQFLAELCRRFAVRGMLSLPVLTIGGRDAACIGGIIERGCFYDVTLAYDESYAELGPGVYLMQQALKRFSEGGVHTVVSHGAHEYKRHWASAFVPQTRIFLFAPRPLALAARVIRFGLRPLWQRLRAGTHTTATATD